MTLYRYALTVLLRAFHAVCTSSALIGWMSVVHDDAQGVTPSPPGARSKVGDAGTVAPAPGKSQVVRGEIDRIATSFAARLA